MRFRLNRFLLTAFLAALFRRMILSESHATFRDHALENPISNSAGRIGAMPRFSWWWKGLLAIYLFGYCFFLIAAGVTTWSYFGIEDWWKYMALQIFYTILWPLFLVFRLVHSV